MLRGRHSRDALRGAVRSQLTSPRELGPCRLYRAKFKPGRKLSGYFGVTTTAPRRAYQSVAVYWSASSFGDGHGRTQDLERLQVERLETEARLRGLLGPFDGLEAYVPAWRMSVRIAPLDPAFPQLVRLSDATYLRHVLGGDRYEVKTIRYRPGQRHVLLIRGEADGRGQWVFAKLSRDTAGATIEGSARALADALAAHGVGVAAVRPLAYLADDDASLWPAVGGTPLSRLLRRADPSLGVHLTGAGRALRVLHDLPAGIAPPGRRTGYPEEVRLIERTCEHVRALLPGTGSRVSEVLERAAASLDRHPAGDAVLAHGDYKSDHLFVDGPRMTMIDLDRCASAERAMDLGKFLADLRWWLGGASTDVLASAQQRFLTGYGRVDRTVLLRAHLYEAMFLLKLAAHRIPVYQSGWPSLTTSVVAQAKSILDGLGRR